MLEDAAVDAAEVTLRQALGLKRSGRPLDPSHMLARPVEMLSARRGASFTEWDGNLGTLAPSEWLAVRPSVGPTTLETYGKCGFRYFARTILRLSETEEPEEREMMEPADRGTLVHAVLERYFTELKQQGRPAPGERWGPADRRKLSAMLDDALSDARKRGLTGREIFAGRESQLLRADLMRFLDVDDEFRASTGAVPDEFEAELPPRTVAGITLRGKVDRVDRTPDGQQAWIIDYKTGRSRDFKGMDANPLLAGTKLQLPAYLAAAKGAKVARALYWFITHAGAFEKITFDATRENIEKFEKTIEAIVSGVAAGSFPAISGDVDEFYGGWKNCGYCEFDRICSRRRDHEYSAKSSDAAMKAWLHVAEAAQGSEDAGESAS
jgi:RecB family exonuclease